MADSNLETALKALATLLEAAVSPAGFKRNEPEPSDIPKDGMVVLLDGDLGEPDVLLGNPVTYGHVNEAEIAIFYKSHKPADRTTGVDGIMQKIVAGVAADETLGGKVDMVTLEPPEKEERHIEGGTSVKAAGVLAIMEFDSTSPLG